MIERAAASQARQPAPPVDTDLLWQALLAATSADAYCRSWLGLVCHDLPEATLAAVLTESAEARTYVPVAVWPAVAPEMSRLGPAVEQVLRERKAVMLETPLEGRPLTCIAYPVIVSGRIAAVIALETGGSQAQVQNALRLIHWRSAWLSNLVIGRELEVAQTGREQLGSVLNMMATALRHKTFRQSLFDVTNELRPRLLCDRVAIGLVDHARVALTAMSEAATFEKNTPLVKAYIAAMEEAYDAGTLVTAAAAGGAASDAPLAPLHAQHVALLKVSGAAHVMSMPLKQGAQCVGILVVEKSGEAGFGLADRDWLDAFGALLASVVVQRRAAERSSLGRLKEECGRFFGKLFGAGHLVLKAGASLALLCAAILALVQIEYRVPAKTVIEGAVQRVAAAPFEGFIGASFVRAGDTVRQGQTLVQLDDRELQIEQARWSSERDQFQNRLREAMANHDLTAVQVIGAQLKQAEAQLMLVTDKIGRARIVAPYDGLVISGDLSQQTGAPVETGKKLFEISPLTSYRVILQVDEREIRHVQAGQKGHLVMTGIAGDPVPLTVVSVTPVAIAQEGKNFFRVEARLSEASLRLRPGMEGIGKVETGRRSLWWILTHSFTDWLRLSLWGWMP